MLKMEKHFQQEVARMSKISKHGIYGNKESNILNKGIITLNNDDSTGVMLNIASTLDNQGTININGKEL